jgi:hypothetical protein
MAGPQLQDAANQCLASWCVKESQKAADDLRVDFPFDGRISNQSFNFGREEQIAIRYAVIKGFDPHAIPREQQFPLARVPQCEGKHTLKLRDTFFSVLLVEVNDYLRVGMGFEKMATLDQIPSEVLKVVDFTIEHNPDGPILVGNWLFPST